MDTRTMLMAEAFANPRASWDLVADFQQLVEYPYMQHAFMASALVAAMTATVGWFMVLRSQAYAGHTLSVVGFPGAAAAVLFGVSPLVGFFAASIIAAAALYAVAGDAGETRGQSAATATVQAFALALGLLIASRIHGSVGTTTAFLFGSFTGISAADVAALAVVTALVVATIAATARPLLFASVDASVAAARGVPAKALSLVFLLALGAAVAGTGPFTGSLLVFALLVAPPAAAQKLSLNPIVSVGLAAVIAVAVAWFGLATAYFTDLPVGFLIATYAFVVYVVAHLVSLVRTGAKA